MQQIIILIFYCNLKQLTRSFPLNLLCFRKPTQNNNSILRPTHNRLTIASQLLPNRFTILKGTRRLYFRNRFRTQARFYIRLTIDSQSPHNCLVNVWFTCGVLGSPLKFLSAIHSFYMRISDFHRFSVILNDSTTMFIDVCKTHRKSKVFLMF